MGEYSARAEVSASAEAEMLAARMAASCHSVDVADGLGSVHRVVVEHDPRAHHIDEHRIMRIALAVRAKRALDVALPPSQSREDSAAVGHFGDSESAPPDAVLRTASLRFVLADRDTDDAQRRRAGGSGLFTLVSGRALTRV